MHIRTTARAALVAVIALVLGALARPLDAQLQIVGYGGGEWDTEDFSVYTLGATVQTTRLGFGPTASVLGYIVNLPDTELVNRITGINPAAGIQYRWPTSAFQVRVGYLFLDADGDLDDVTGGVIGGTEDGLTTAAQYIYWGTGARTLELIGNYNWGDGYYWTRARAGQRLLTTGGGSGLSLGGEVVYQGNEDATILQLGPTVEWAMGSGLRLVGVVGYKMQEVYDDGAYFKAEFVFIP